MKELGLVRRPIRVGPPPRPPRRRRRRRPTTTYQNGFEAAGARAGAIFGAIGGNAGLGARIVAGAGLLGGCSSINPGGLRRLHSNGVTPRDAAGHRRPRHGERRTNYRAVIAQMRCRSSIARHPSFHLPDTQIQRRPFHRYSDHASNESGANGSAAASTNGTPLPVTTGRSALSTWRNSTFYPSAA